MRGDSLFLLKKINRNNGDVMKRIFTISLFLIFNMVLFAQIPGLLSYQGYITDANNIPRNGNVIITFFN